jgi:hypothetical protein
MAWYDADAARRTVNPEFDALTDRILAAQARALG